MYTFLDMEPNRKPPPQSFEDYVTLADEESRAVIEGLRRVDNLVQVLQIELGSARGSSLDLFNTVSILDAIATGFQRFDHLATQLNAMVVQLRDRARQPIQPRSSLLFQHPHCPWSLIRAKHPPQTCLLGPQPSLPTSPLFLPSGRKAVGQIICYLVHPCWGSQTLTGRRRPKRLYACNECGTPKPESAAGILSIGEYLKTTWAHHIRHWILFRRCY